MKCPNQKRNLQNCNCSYPTCFRKGVCCECIVYHRNNNELPACYFSKGAEKTFDRSIKNFIQQNN